MTEQELHEKIIAYLEGRLSPEAADEFRLQIEADEALAGEVELHRLLQQVGQRLVALDMKAKFDSWQKKAERSEVSVRRREVGAMHSIKENYVWKEKTQSYKQLAHSELASLINIIRSDIRGSKVRADEERRSRYWTFSDFRDMRRGANAGDLLAKADTAIEKRLYRLAENMLLGISATDPQYPRALEMLAYTYMMQEKYVAAIETYLMYIPYNADSDETNWHLCLYYLADYPVYQSEFQQLLQTILADTEHFYHDRAKSLRKKLAEANVWPE